jgi:hypothetical protein
MNDTLLSILYDQEESWSCNPYAWQSIKFNKDRTGEVRTIPLLYRLISIVIKYGI